MKLSAIERSVSHLGCVEYCTALALFGFYPRKLTAIKQTRPSGQKVYGQHFQNTVQDIGEEAARRGLKYQDVYESDGRSPNVERLANALESHMMDGFVIASGFKHMELYLVEDGRVQRHTNTVDRRIEQRTLWPLGDARWWLHRFQLSDEPGHFEIIASALRMMEFDRAKFTSAYFMADRIITMDIFEQAIAAITSS